MKKFKHLAWLLAISMAFGQNMASQAAVSGIKETADAIADAVDHTDPTDLDKKRATTSVADKTATPSVPDSKEDEKSDALPSVATSSNAYLRTFEKADPENMPAYYQYDDEKEIYFFESRSGKTEYRTYGRFEDEPTDSWYPAKSNGKVHGTDSIDETLEYYTIAPLHYVTFNPEEFDDSAKIWKQFNETYGSLNASTNNMDYLPMYSETLGEYPYETFGAWEWSDLSDEENPQYAYFIYGYIDNKEEPDTESVLKQAYGSHWIQVDNQKATAFANFYRHNLSAETVNGNTLRIHIDVKVEDTSGGDSGVCEYKLSPQSENNGYTNALQYPWITMRSTVIARYGTITTEYYDAKSTSNR